MKCLFAFGVILLSSSVIEAQVHSPSPIGPSAPALGGSYAGRAISRPLGGVALPAFPGSQKSRPQKRVGATGYFGPVYYIPNAFDSYSDYVQPAPPPPGGDYSGQPAQPPVIINQYFGTRNPPETNRETTTHNENGSTTTFQGPSEQNPNPGDPIGIPENYYLIAYKDHTVFTALAYWVEDKTLHYVTTQNTHNQASLDLIDLAQTTKLNADRAVPFSISGK